MIAGRWANRARGVLGVLALGAVVAACGGSKFQYVQNSSENTYFKLPSNWKLYKLTEPDKQGRVPKLPVGTQRIWHVAFDAAPQPDQNHLGEAMPTAMVGDVQIYAMSASDNDQIAQSNLRQIIFGGIDPILQDPGTPPNWEVVSYTPVTDVKGVVGSRVVINIPSQDSPGQWFTLDGTELLDSADGRAYLLLMRCESQCYLNNRKAADEIASSWKVTK
jgi:hypothetical protein